MDPVVITAVATASGAGCRLFAEYLRLRRRLDEEAARQTTLVTVIGVLPTGSRLRVVSSDSNHLRVLICHNHGDAGGCW